MPKDFMKRSKGMFTSDRDDWETPQSLFEKLDATYGFTLDPCSTHENAKCSKHYTSEDDGLSKSWASETVFCNPPYGREIPKWVRKCADESRHAKVVMLVPARTNTAWFHDYIYGKAKVTFLRGRVKFERGGGRAPSCPVPFDGSGVLR